MISVQNANAYFAAHVFGKAWGEYTGEQKDKAILQARRDLSRALARPIRDDEPPYREGDPTRDEYAVYEQAVYLLLRDVLPEGSGDATAPLDESKASPTPRSVCGRWSADALSWLGERLVFSARLV